MCTIIFRYHIDDEIYDIVKVFTLVVLCGYNFSHSKYKLLMKKIKDLLPC